MNYLDVWYNYAHLQSFIPLFLSFFVTCSGSTFKQNVDVIRTVLWTVFVPHIWVSLNGRVKVSVLNMLRLFSFFLGREGGVGAGVRGKQLSGRCSPYVMSCLNKLVLKRKMSQAEGICLSVACPLCVCSLPHPDPHPPRYHQCMTGGILQAKSSGQPLQHLLGIFHSNV